MSSQATNTAVFVAILAVIVIAIIDLFVLSRKSERPPEEDKPTPPPVHPPKPDKSDDKPEEKGTRVVTSLSPQKAKSDADKAKIPSEAEFKQLMAWKPPASEVKTCSCCGAEIGRLVSICPACGQAN